MREILAINPRRKKPAKKSRKKRISAMPKKRKAKRRKARKNPSSKISRVRRAGSKLTSGLNIRAALKDQIPIQIGMLASKWAEKRFGPEASDLDPTSWNWASYAKGGLGAFVAAMIANMVKPGMGQKVLTGGLSQVVNRLVRNELIEKSPFAIAQLGQSEPIVVDEDGTPYISDDGQYIPIDEGYRQEPMGYIGDSLVSPGPLGSLEPVGPLGMGEGTGDFSRYMEAYRQ